MNLDDHPSDVDWGGSVIRSTPFRVAHEIQQHYRPGKSPRDQRDFEGFGEKPLGRQSHDEGTDGGGQQIADNPNMIVAVEIQSRRPSDDVGDGKQQNWVQCVHRCALQFLTTQLTFFGGVAHGTPPSQKRARCEPGP